MSVFAFQMQKPVGVVSLPPDISPNRFSSPVFVRPTNPVNQTMTSVQPRVVSMSGTAAVLQSSRQAGNFMAPPRVTTLPNAPVNVQKRTPAIIRAPSGIVAHRINTAQPVSAPKIVRLSRPASASNVMRVGGQLVRLHGPQTVAKPAKQEQQESPANETRAVNHNDSSHFNNDV